MSHLGSALDRGSLAPEHGARRILAKRLPAGDGRGRCSSPWRGEFFGLDRVGVFRDATDDAREAVVARCGRDVLTEAYFIEKTGVHFAARMVLLSESVTESQLYAVFAAEEALHFERISSHVQPDESSWRTNPFLDLLVEMIDGGSRPVLQLMVQVVLEGWGLSHYRELRNGTCDDALRGDLDAILADEAGHHGSGLALLRGRTLSSGDRELAEEVLVRFLDMVRAGPMSVLQALCEELGPLSRRETVAVLHQLRATEHSARRLATLRALAAKCEAARPLLDRVSELGCFEPRAPEDLA